MVKVGRGFERKYKVLIEEMLPNYRGQIRDTVRNRKGVLRDEWRQSEPMLDHEVQAQEEDIKQHGGDEGGDHEEVLLFHLERRFLQLLLPFLHFVACRDEQIEAELEQAAQHGIHVLHPCQQLPHFARFVLLPSARVYRRDIRRTVAPTIFRLLAVDERQLAQLDLRVVFLRRAQVGE